MKGKLQFPHMIQKDLKGTAEYVTEGAIVAAFKTAVEGMFKGAATAKGALIITPSKVIVTTPGADNKKEI